MVKCNLPLAAGLRAGSNSYDRDTNPTPQHNQRNPADSPDSPSARANAVAAYTAVNTNPKPDKTDTRSSRSLLARHEQPQPDAQAIKRPAPG